MLRGFVPDVVVSHAVSGLYVGRAVAGWRGAHLIVSDHSGGTLSNRRELMVRLMRQQVDLVVTVASGQTRAWMERGYPRQRIVTVPNGVETPKVAESKAAIRRELKIPDGAVVATLVASFRRLKRIPDFIDAVSRVRGSHPELVGLVVGDGPERPAIESAAAGNRAIRLLGHRDDVPRILKAADMLVLTSEYEAAPMAILEAMAAGLPVIATDVGSVREMIADGASGLLVSPCTPDQLTSKLALLAGDATLRRAMGRAAMQQHRQSWTAERMIEDYARLISHPGGLEDMCSFRAWRCNKTAGRG
jgi:glycosyltransferase involved in cell wall biosynthesis